jgi:hypothetical protein
MNFHYNNMSLSRVYAYSPPPPIPCTASRYYVYYLLYNVQTKLSTYVRFVSKYECPDISHHFCFIYLFILFYTNFIINIVHLKLITLHVINI